MNKILFLWNLGIRPFFAVPFFIIVKRFLKIQFTYPVELYKALNFVQFNGGSIVKNNNGWTVNFDLQGIMRQCLIRKKTSDSAVFIQVFNEREYLPLVHLSCSLLNQEIRTIADVGANVGYTSLFLHAYFPKAKLLAIEPDPENFRALMHNISLNRMADVQCYQAALWSRREALTIAADFRDKREWSRRVSNEVGSRGTVEAMLPKQLLDLFESGTIDLLKVDIEGAEELVFSSYEDSVQFFRHVKFIAIELHGNATFKQSFEQILSTSGFAYTYFSETLFGMNLMRI
jgi:FkbM family methyltransferase